MSAYDNDPRVELRNGAYIVDGRWAVMESGSKWDAYLYPACTDPAHSQDAPVGGYRAGTATADEKIRELIGDRR